MARNTRSALPGRAQPQGANLDRLVFGPRESQGDDESDQDVGNIEFADRAAKDRRRVARRKADFSRLPNDNSRYRPPEENKRGMVILVLAVAIVGVFGAVVWNAYREGVRSSDGAATPELAMAGPFKSRPVGSDIEAKPDVEASVFERVESAPRTAIDMPAGEAESTPEVRPERLPPPVAAPVVAPVGQTAAASVQPPATKPAASTRPTPVTAASLPKPTQSPATKTQPVTPQITAPSAVSGYGPAFSADGGFVVQVAAPSTEAAALAEWEKRRKGMPELFEAAERFVVRADVNGKTVYRLRAGSFATAADADAFCGAIKAKGGDCYRTAR